MILNGIMKVYLLNITSVCIVTIVFLNSMHLLISCISVTSTSLIMGMSRITLRAAVSVALIATVIVKEKTL